MNVFLALMFFSLPLVWSGYVNANYVTTKTFFLFFLSSLSLFALPTEFKIRHWPRSLWMSFIFVVLYHLLWAIKDGDYYGFLMSFKVFSFFFLVLYFYSLSLTLTDFLKKCHWLIFLSASFIFTVTFEQMISAYLMRGHVVTGTILSTFGNVNMSAEFFVLTLPLLAVWGRTPGPLPALLRYFFLASAVYMILFLNSRSAWIGLGLWVLLKCYLRLNKKEILALALGLTLYLAGNIILSDAGNVETKAASAGERMMLYKGSLEMLQDSAFGQPMGSYLSHIIPYIGAANEKLNEYNFFDQPHSELLKWGIQFGWPLLAISLFILSWMGLFLLKNIIRSEKSGSIVNEKHFLAETFIVLLPQIAFQFPFENPASLLYLSFVLALFLIQFSEKSIFKLSYLKTSLCVLASVGLIQSFLFISAVYFESAGSRSIDLMKVSCLFYPAHYRGCFWKQANYIENRRYADFNTEYVRDMSRLPLYPDYMRLLPGYFSSIGNEKKMCESLQIYSAIYRQQRHFPTELVQQCRTAYRAPFDLEKTSHFTKNYLSWLRSQ